jgi:hypothetical protein
VINYQLWQNRNLFLLACAGSKPVSQKVIFLSRNTTWQSIMEGYSQCYLNFVLAEVVTTTESKSVSLGLRRFETCRRDGNFFSLGAHLDIHPWTVAPSQRFISTSSWPETCFSLTAQVPNLRTRWLLFTLEIHLDIHSWVISLEVYLNFVLAEVVATTEWKSVSLRLRRFETCRRHAFSFCWNTP